MTATATLAAVESRSTTVARRGAAELLGGEDTDDEQAGDPQGGCGVVGDVDGHAELGPALGGRVSGPRPGAEDGDGAERDRRCVGPRRRRWECGTAAPTAPRRAGCAPARAMPALVFSAASSEPSADHGARVGDVGGHDEELQHREDGHGDEGPADDLSQDRLLGGAAPDVAVGEDDPDDGHDGEVGPVAQHPPQRIRHRQRSSTCTGVAPDAQRRPASTIGGGGVVVAGGARRRRVWSSRRCRGRAGGGGRADGEGDTAGEGVSVGSDEPPAEGRLAGARAVAGRRRRRRRWRRG